MVIPENKSSSFQKLDFFGIHLTLLAIMTIITIPQDKELYCSEYNSLGIIIQHQFYALQFDKEVYVNIVLFQFSFLGNFTDNNLVNALTILKKLLVESALILFHFIMGIVYQEILVLKYQFSVHQILPNSDDLKEFWQFSKNCNGNYQLHMKKVMKIPNLLQWQFCFFTIPWALHFPKLLA